MPGRLFAGSGFIPFGLGDIRYSDDGTVFAYGFGLHGASISSLSVDPLAPAHVLAVGSGGSYASESAGSSWSGTEEQPEALAVSVAFDPDEPGVVYEGGASSVNKSLDGGETWARAYFGLPRAVIRPVLPVPATTGMVLAGTAVGVYRTTDGATSWQSTTGGPASNVWALAEGFSGVVWAGADDGVYRSADQGATWTRAGNVAGPVRAVLDSSVAGRVFAGTDAGLFVSGDAGATWAPAEGGIPAGLEIHALAEDPGKGSVYVGAFPGVYESRDGGSTWRATVDGLTNPYVQTLALAGNGFLLAGTQAGSIFRLAAPAPVVERGGVARLAAPSGTRPIPPRPQFQAPRRR